MYFSSSIVAIIFFTIHNSGNRVFLQLECLFTPARAWLPISATYHYYRGMEGVTMNLILSSVKSIMAIIDLSYRCMVEFTLWNKHMGAQHPAFRVLSSGGTIILQWKKPQQQLYEYEQIFYLHSSKEPLCSCNSSFSAARTADTLSAALHISLLYYFYSQKT